MASLYKVLRYWKNTEPLKTTFPLQIHREEIRLEIDAIKCDIYDFEQYYSRKDDIDGLCQAVEIYTGSLLYNEYYEWTVEMEGFYEIHYFEILKLLADYYARLGETTKSYYYKQKLGTMG